MLISIIKKIINARKEAKRNEYENARAELMNTYLRFTEGEGRLPVGFSHFYNEIRSGSCFVEGPDTPFGEYLQKIIESEDIERMMDSTGISDWFYLDESAEINAAAASICNWVKRHREMDSELGRKIRIGEHYVSSPVPYRYFYGKFMIVIGDRHRFDDFAEDSVQNCKALNISFCVLLSDHQLYDLIEQKEKKITYQTGPNFSGDATYASWRIEECQPHPSDP